MISRLAFWKNRRLFVTPAGDGLSAPTVTACAAPTGNAGDTVTIRGTGFRSSWLTVTFGGVAALVYLIAPDAKSFTCTVPPGSGAVDIVVTTAEGTSAPLVGGFTYGGVVTFHLLTEAGDILNLETSDRLRTE